MENPPTLAERKNMYHALNYTLMGNKLFKKTPEEILLKCLSESEAYLALLNVHSRECEAHQVGHKIKWLLFQQGIYWSTMLKNCIEFAKRCQECQVHADTQHIRARKLHSIDL